MFVGLSESELEVMNYIWKAEAPVSFGEMLKFFLEETEREWKKQTLNTFLLRMQEKKVLEISIVRGRKRYAPALTREEYMAAEARAFLDKRHGGSLKNFIRTLGGGEKLPKNEVDELKELLKR